MPLGKTLQLAEIDGQLGRQRGLAHAFDLLRQQLVDGDAVEGRDLVQAGDRDIPVAALIGRQQRPLEALIRKHFDLLERQATLLAQTTQPGSNFSRIPVQWIPL